MNKRKFITKILHNPLSKEDPHGSLHMPVYENVTFEFKTSEEAELAFQRKKPAHVYSRITNPTVEAYEQRIRAVTEAVGVVAVSSGMAAIANMIMTVAGSGDNIITTKHIFGNTYSLFTRTLKSWGLEVRDADLTKPEELAGLIDDKTRMLFLETITNPQIEVADIKALADIAKAKDVLVVVDTTLTPPYAFNSKEHGVDVEVLSSTKYISGGATSVGGLIIDNGTYDWSKNPKLKPDYEICGKLALINLLRRQVYRNLGSCLSPHNAFLQSVGLETLPLRVDVSSANALKVAQFLEKHKKVKGVNYPGLKSSPFYKTAKKQFGNKTSCLLTFDLESKEQCYKLMNEVTFIRRTTNMCDNRTLILHPGATIFCEYDDATKRAMNVRETMIRMSIGIEDADDIIGDLSQALEKI